MPASRHDPVGTIIPHDLKILTEEHTDEKLAIKILIVGAGHSSFLVVNKWYHYYSQ